MMHAVFLPSIQIMSLAKYFNIISSTLVKNSHQNNVSIDCFKPVVLAFQPSLPSTTFSTQLPPSSVSSATYSSPLPPSFSICTCLSTICLQQHSSTIQYSTNQGSFSLSSTFSLLISLLWPVNLLSQQRRLSLHCCHFFSGVVRLMFLLKALIFC